MTLGIPGFEYPDLYRRERLADLLRAFEEDLSARDAGLAETYGELRAGGPPQSAPELSAALIALAPKVASFVTRLFGVEEEYRALIERLSQDAPPLRFHRHFQKRVFPRWKKEDLAALDPAREAAAVDALISATLGPSGGSDRAAGGFAGAAPAGSDEAELRFTRAALAWIDREEAVSDDDPAAAEARAAVELMERRAAWLHHYGEERKSWVSLRVPEGLDYQELVRREHPQPELPELFVGPAETRRLRAGFRLTDPRMGARAIAAEADYCILCHPREKDSCSRGLREKNGAPKSNPLSIPLAGCPLEEKISEAHALRRAGESLAALVLVMIDNPMCPGTGHRICNDCMKACIFQKQEPVNIPQVETGLLSEVLSLPFGVEIYLLLTRWNPLQFRRPVPAPMNGRKVLVVGLGPAGYTLSHYLLNEGFAVVGIDGLKIEPLPENLAPGEDGLPRPIRDYRELYQELDRRVLSGFGGVSEYGITVRWDKNFLTLIHLALARREGFRFYGGVRFGGTLTLEDCWELGFDHVAIAAGAGKPTVLQMRGGLSRGIRQASDFLMTLQLTGAFKKESLANLQIRLPALVIGGGLTAIDTATELMAYYPLQVEKTLERFEVLSARLGEPAVLERMDPEERGILHEFLAHGRAVRAERARAAAAGRPPDFAELVQGWGGVTIAYRRSLQESPAYRLNHEEVIKCLEEGVRFAERLSPVEAVCDSFGAVAAVEFARLGLVEGKLRPTGAMVRLPARSVCVAAGTSPNVIYEREHPGTFCLDENQRFFASHVAERDQEGKFRLRRAGKGETGFFTSYEHEGRLVSYYGDNHPVYAGNVVKAMASARDGYGKVVELFSGAAAPPTAAAASGSVTHALASGFESPSPAIAQGDSSSDPENSSAASDARSSAVAPAAARAAFTELAARLDDELAGRVVRVERLTPTIVDLVVRSPMAARKFQPGQFYRLQNFESDSPLVQDTRFALEGIALTGAWVDRERGLLSLIVLEMGASSRLCATLKPGARVVVMGPTGSPTEIPQGEKILLAGGGLGNAVLFSIAQAMRAAGNRVVYFAGYKDGADLFKREEIEKATDQVIWSTDRGQMITPARRFDRHFRGNIVQSMVAYAEGSLGETVFPLREVNRILAIGSDKMMAAVKRARHESLKPYLGAHTALGSINSSMQCMLKEVCAQCLQQHLDPQTGLPSHAVFTCFCQDQILDEVDFGNLADRLRMNSLQEKITNLWLEHLLESSGLPRV